MAKKSPRKLRCWGLGIMQGHENIPRSADESILYFCLMQRVSAAITRKYISNDDKEFQREVNERLCADPVAEVLRRLGPGYEYAETLVERYMQIDPATGEIVILYRLPCRTTKPARSKTSAVKLPMKQSDPSLN